MPDIKDSDQFVLRTLPDYSGERKCCRSMKTIKTKNVDVITHNTVFADFTILSVYQFAINSEPNSQRTIVVSVHGDKKTQLVSGQTGIFASIQPGQN